MFKNILITLDGSDLSEEALSVAKDLLEGSETDATLFIVAEMPHPAGRRGRPIRRPLPLPAYSTGQFFVPAVNPRGPLDFAESKSQALERREHETIEYLDRAGRPLVETGASIHAAVHFGEAAK